MNKCRTLNLTLKTLSMHHVIFISLLGIHQIWQLVGELNPAWRRGLEPKYGLYHAWAFEWVTVVKLVGEQDLTLTVRGTDSQNIDDLLIDDVNPMGTGAGLFKTPGSAEIIAGHIKSSETLATLNLTGHSAGGSISMLILDYVLANYDKDFSHIKTINLVVFPISGC